MNETEFSVFERSGLAALSDIQRPEWLDLFNHLEQGQTEFLAKEENFRSPMYIWPRDSLHTWSRIWEYPYVYYHLRSRLRTISCLSLPKVVDVGCGVTFFPFSIAKLGCHVICTDIDPTCKTDIERAAQHVSQGDGKIEFRLTSSALLPLIDGEADVVYCISVLEHIPEFEETVEEIARILKPGGLLILTIDIDLKGNAEIGTQGYKRLTECLAKKFNLMNHETTIHPGDLLTSTTGPYPMHNASVRQLLWFWTKQWLIKPLLGRKPIRNMNLRLAVFGSVLEKKRNI